MFFPLDQRIAVDSLDSDSHTGEIASCFFI